MALLFLDEDVPESVAEALRSLGHDVLTVAQAGRKGQTDLDQLAFALAEGRAIVTHNRRDYIRLHRQVVNHAGIIACTRDADDLALAGRIHNAISQYSDLHDQLLRVNRPTANP